MAYELIQKKLREEEGRERVTISRTGRQFFLSSAAAKLHFADSSFVHIYVDKDSDGDKVRVAFKPLRKAEPEAYSVIKPKKSRAGYITARGTLKAIGYKNNQSYPLDVQWVERNINGRRTGVLEFEIDRKYCTLK